MPPFRGGADARDLVRFRAVHEVVALDVSASLVQWERLVASMVAWPIASQNIRTHAPIPCAGPLPLDEAITCGWIAVNSERRVLALCIDIDHADGPELVARLPSGCPKPMLVICPWSGRAHAVLPLASPVHTGPAARPKPISLASYALRLLAAALRGTPLPFTSLVKCPTALVHNLTGQRMLRGPRPANPAVWNAYVASGTDLMWITQPGDGPAELWDVVNALADEYGGQVSSPRPRARWRKDRGEPSAYGRNCQLFDEVRWWAYEHEECTFECILREALDRNARFPVPLPASEIGSIARSITKFMRGRYKPRYGNGRRGRDHKLNRDLTTQERQALAGRQSALQRKAANDDRLLVAMTALQTAGKKVTQRAVAEQAGLSERTVRSRWSVLTQQPPSLAETAASAAAQELPSNILSAPQPRMNAAKHATESAPSSETGSTGPVIGVEEDSATVNRQDAGPSALLDTSELLLDRLAAAVGWESAQQISVARQLRRPDHETAACFGIQPAASLNAAQLPQAMQDGGDAERRLPSAAADGGPPPPRSHRNSDRPPLILVFARPVQLTGPEWWRRPRRDGGGAGGSSSPSRMLAAVPRPPPSGDAAASVR